jgi:tetratricopeptide (TPR) repeat protein
MRKSRSRAMVGFDISKRTLAAMAQVLIDDLKKQIEDRQAIAIVGAGVSVDATGNAPAASWVGLLKDGVARCQDVARPPVGWADRQRAALDTGDLDELLGVAEQVSRRLGYPEAGEWRRWLRETVGQLRATDSRVLEALRDLEIPIATTNYDSLVENATGWPAVTWREAPQVERVLRGDDDGVLHLHGHWQVPASVVLGIRSYEAVLGDAHAQTVLRSLRLRHTLVFIGCGAGLRDPNLGALLAWSRPILSGSEYRHFQLCRTSEREELERQHPRKERIFPVPFGEKHEDIAPFLRDLAPRRRSDRAGKNGPATDVVALPPKPARCIGRGDEVEALVGALLAGEPVPVLGPAGIGKSTVCLEALHDQRVAGRFGERRYFVRLDGAATAKDTLAGIGAVLGIPADQASIGSVIGRLADGPAALALDNLETPWEAETLETEALLAGLAAAPGVSLAVTLRGGNRPAGVPWRDRVEVKPLGSDDARRVFLAIAGERHAADRYLAMLLAALDGLPLAIELLAYAAEAESDLQDVWQRWQAERTRMLTRGVANHRLLSLAVSLEISIASPRMTNEARRLLALLGQLPDGIARADLDVLMPGIGQPRAATLRQVGLAFNEAGRLRTLAPIREHCASTRPPEADDLQIAVRCYAALATELGPKCGGTGGQEAALRLRAEAANIEAILIQGIEEAPPEIVTQAAIAFGECQRLTGIGTTILLRKAAELAETVGDHALAGSARRRLAQILRNRSEHNEAGAQFAKAELHFRRIGDQRGKADCLYGVGRIADFRRNDEEADALFEAALALYEALEEPVGVANCHAFLGDLAHRRGREEEARNRYDRAAMLFQRARNLEGEANCLGRIGDLESYNSNLPEAERYYRKALPMLHQIADIRGECVCLTRLGGISLSHGDYDKARECFKEALPLSRLVGDVLIETHCLNILDILGGHPADTVFIGLIESVVRHKIIETIRDADELAKCLKATRAAFASIGSEGEFILHLGNVGELQLKVVRSGADVMLSLKGSGAFADKAFVETLTDLKDQMQAKS